MQTDKFENMIVNYLKRKKIIKVMSLGIGDYNYFKDENGNEYYLCCGLVDAPTKEMKERRFDMVNRK